MIFGDPNKSGGFQNMLQRFAVYNFSNNDEDMVKVSEFLFNKGFDVNYIDDPDSFSGESLKISSRENMFMLIMVMYDVLEEMISTQNKDVIDIS